MVAPSTDIQAGPSSSQTRPKDRDTGAPTGVTANEGEEGVSVHAGDDGGDEHDISDGEEQADGQGQQK